MNPEPAAPPAGSTVTPADAADAARLVAFGLQPKLAPARDQEYTELLRRYRDDPAFARLADAVAAGLGLVVGGVPARGHGRDRRRGLGLRRPAWVTTRVAPPPTPATASCTDSPISRSPRWRSRARRTWPTTLHRPGPVNGVDAFVRQACRRLEERAEEQGENTDPATDAPGLEAAWRIWARRSATGATRDARRPAASTTGIVAKALAFLTDSGFLQRTGDDNGGTYRTTARYQLQVRDMAGNAALTELLELGVVPVTDGTATLSCPPRTPRTWTWWPTPGCRSTPDARKLPQPQTSPNHRTFHQTYESPPCTSCPGSASTPSVRPVRATPTPCLTCGVSASPCPTRRPRRRSSSRRSRPVRRAGPRPRACCSWRTAAASPSCSS